MMMKTILILPVYNEAKGIVEIIKESQPYVDFVIVVDDGSTDSSYKLALKTKALVMRHPVNLGKAAALKTGVQLALKKGADIIIFMDSDGQHSPKDLPRFIGPLKKGRTKVVLGYRTGGDQMPFFRKTGRWLVQKLLRLLYGFSFHDILSGYRSFKTDVYPKLEWQAKGYDIEAEMAVRIGKHRLKYKQIPIETIYHDEFKGMTIMNGISLFLKIILWRFSL
tara:strand:+ start:176 stop:841 length:666 start_codon:yes stop_codon:yes gene_type:complete